MIDDEYIIKYFFYYRNHERLNHKKLLNIPNNILKYLNSRYNDSDSIEETIVRIKNKIENKPVCNICGKKLIYTKLPNIPYRKTCSYNCSRKQASQTQIITLQKEYGENIINISQIDDVKKKKIKTCLKNYGVENPLQNKEILKRTQETKIKKYGDKNHFEKYKQTCLERYGVENPMQSKDILDKFDFKSVIRKMHITKRKNHTFNTSRPEEYIYERLCEIFTADNVIRQYHTEEYPFDCDFYIIPLNLYIEYQGMWTHNDHPFDETNENDLKIVESWRQKNSTFYNGAINVWTKRDVLKRNTAKKNNLNWIEFFNLSQFDEWLNQLFT